MDTKVKNGAPGGSEAEARAVRSALTRARLYWVLSRGAAALAAALVPAAVYLSAAALADRLFFLDERLRLAGLAVFLGLALFRLYAGFLRPLSSLDRARLSSEIGKASPELRLHIGPAADLTAPGAGDPGPFGAAHIKQTAGLLSANGAALPPSGLRERLPAAAAAAAALLLSAVFNPASLARVSLPAAAEPLENSLLVRPGDYSAREGEPVAVEASWLNGSPGKPVLSLRPPGGNWARREWSECGPGSCRREVEVRPGGLEYRLEFRGRRTRVYSLTFLPRPGFLSLECEFFPPAYSGLPPSAPGYCPVSAEMTRGGWIRMTAVPSYAPAAISLSGPGGGRNFFSSLPAGKWELALRPSSPGPYYAEFTDGDGARSRLGEVINLDLKEDAPPAAGLPGSAGGPDGVVALLCEASDDLGVAEVVVERRVRGFPSLDRDYRVYASTPPGDRSLLAEEFFSLHDLPAGTEASFRVRVRDFNPASAWSFSRPAAVKTGAPTLSAGGEIFRARAALESIAYQTRDVLECMEEDSGMELKELRVDGGAAANEFLMQFQADILGVPVVIQATTETTALGAAYLAGLAVGFWKDQTQIASNYQVKRKFVPRMSSKQRESLYRRWKMAVERVKGWEQERS
jgi:hypothetical protein